MIFVSRNKGLRLIKKPVRRIVDVRGRTSSIDKPQRVHFIPMVGKIPIPNWKLPLRGERRDWGAMDTRVAAEQCGIPEQELIDWLKAHPRYGVEFTSVEDEPQKVKEGKDDWIVKSGDGFYCKLCEDVIQNKTGMKSHSRGKKHQDNLEIVQQKAISVAKKEVTSQEKAV